MSGIKRNLMRQIADLEQQLKDERTRNRYLATDAENLRRKSNGEIDKKIAELEATYKSMLESLSEHSYSRHAGAQMYSLRLSFDAQHIAVMHGIPNAWEFVVRDLCHRISRELLSMKFVRMSLDEESRVYNANQERMRRNMERFTQQPKETP